MDGVVQRRVWVEGPDKTVMSLATNDKSPSCTLNRKLREGTL